MPLRVYTSQYGYSGTDRLDITVKSSDGVFAPSWELVHGIKERRITPEQYTERYLALLRTSYRQKHQKWEDLLQQSRVTLVCFCSHGMFCHRLILADVLTKLGAVYMGEVNRSGQLIG